MTAAEILDQIFSNLLDVGNSVSKQMAAHQKNLQLVEEVMKKEYARGVLAGKSEAENKERIIRNN